MMVRASGAGAESGCAPAQQSQQRSGPGSGSKEVGQAVGPLGKLDGFDSRLIKQNGALEHIHGRGIQPRAKIDVAPAVLGRRS